MDNKLSILLDGTSQVEYDRTKKLPQNQLEYLNLMDQQMSNGIHMGNKNISNPNQLERAYFVANQLLIAIQTDNEMLASAACAYLANRIPDLKQVEAKKQGASLSILLRFDKQMKEAVSVNFSMPN